MNIQLVGIKEFRQNLASLTRRASKRNERMIVLRKNAPLFEVLPIKKDDGDNIFVTQSGKDILKELGPISATEAKYYSNL